jgi:hypothetical protein
MYRAVGARVTLDWKDATTAAIAAAAVPVTWKWATEGLKTAPESWTDGELNDGVVNVTALHAGDEQRDLYHIAVRRADDWDAALTWRTTVDLMCGPEQVECGVAVDLDMPTQRIAPSPLQPPLLALLQELVRRGGRAGTQRVSRDARTVMGADGVESLVSRTLSDDGRQLPVLLFTSVKEKDGTYLPEGTDPSLVARELCGIAHVYMVPRAEDTHRLTRRLGSLTAYDGAIRIYWPGFTDSDPPPRHPLFVRRRLNPSSVPAIIRRITDAGARSYAPPDGTATLVAIHWRKRELERIRAAVEAEPDSAHAISLLHVELLNAIEANVQLEEELDSLRDQLSRLQLQVAGNGHADLEGSAQVAAMKPATTRASSSP